MKDDGWYVWDQWRCIWVANTLGNPAADFSSWVTPQAFLVSGSSRKATEVLNRTFSFSLHMFDTKIKDPDF